MAGHTSEKRWNSNALNTEGISILVKSTASNLITVLYAAEELYLDLLELFNYAGGTNQDLANQLFKEDIEDRSESISNAEELAKATDAIATMLAAHELFQAADNVATSQSDRFSSLRRMS